MATETKALCREGNSVPTAENGSLWNLLHVWKPAVCYTTTSIAQLDICCTSKSLCGALRACLLCGDYNAQIVYSEGILVDVHIYSLLYPS